MPIKIGGMKRFIRIRNDGIEFFRLVKKDGNFYHWKAFMLYYNPIKLIKSFFGRHNAKSI